MSSHSFEPSSVDAPLAEANSAQVPATNNVVIGGIMGLVLLHTVFIVIRCFGNSADPNCKHLKVNRQSPPILLGQTILTSSCDGVTDDLRLGSTRL